MDPRPIYYADRSPGVSSVADTQDIDRAAPARVLVTVQASPEWRAWLSRLADHCEMPSSVLIDQAVRRLARSRGFGEPAPHRFRRPGAHQEGGEHGRAAQAG